MTKIILIGFGIVFLIGLGIGWKLGWALHPGNSQQRVEFMSADELLGITNWSGLGQTGDPFADYLEFKKELSND